jgi:hypothetical protein
MLALGAQMLAPASMWYFSPVAGSFSGPGVLGASRRGCADAQSGRGGERVDEQHLISA